MKTTKHQSSLVHRIANDGTIRIKLSTIQKRVIRYAEQKRLWLYQCTSCTDRPFFVGGAIYAHLESSSPCHWCGTEVQKHKHQCDNESFVEE